MADCFIEINNANLVVDVVVVEEDQVVPYVSVFLFRDNSVHVVPNVAVFAESDHAVQDVGFFISR